MQKFSYLQVGNAEYIDQLFEQYRKDPSSVEETWRYLFEGMELGALEAAARAAPQPTSNGHASAAPTSSAGWERELRVVDLIHAYRRRGLWLAHLNPLDGAPSSHPELDLARFGLTQNDLSQTYAAGNLVGMPGAKLGDIVQMLRDTYCRTIGAEFEHLENREIREWVRSKLEQNRGTEKFDTETRKFLLKRVSEADRFEYFLHTRYVAQKRFSIEGGESLIPALDRIVEIGAELGATEFVMGMAHRGRLNVLTHVMGKKPETILVEFEGNYKVDPAKGDGDVKYHKGYLADSTTRTGKKVRLTLAANPSHLEFVNPVVEGMARARQDQLGGDSMTAVVPVLMHGDAAFAGQGVCYETLQMAGLDGYNTGGTIHIVINNQVGFTTDPDDARSTPYCTDLARMFDGAPIFHVNGDDVEAVAFLGRLAIEFRQKFKRDIFIDLICYRKHGHNEGDEPAFTQPLLYKKIKVQPTVRARYAERLAQEGVITATEADEINQALVDKLENAQKLARAGGILPKNSDLEESWKKYRSGQPQDTHAPVRTELPAKTLLELGEKIYAAPAGFQVHPKLARFFDGRLGSLREGKGLDWGNGEALAFASLLAEGHRVRMTGQDVQRGTFSHRQSVLHDHETGQVHAIFKAAETSTAKYLAYNSFLSETAVMGYEYGYSLVSPESLTIWEAQFGDFSNGAQVIIDQFLASGETKWQRMSGLVLLLPHGYEGQGPEHSSARMERFLQLSGSDNWIVANLSTPAQIFHALRRQVKREFRKPLVIMSPKSLLRHPLAVSELSEFTQSGFQEVIDDPKLQGKGKGVKRVVLCSGKIYYELSEARGARTDVAVVRVEQLYPWPAARLTEILSQYPDAKEIVWAQEEPRNMGAWGHVFGMWMGGLEDFSKKVGGRAIYYVGRPVSSSPAVGSTKWHQEQQASIIQSALN